MTPHAHPARLILASRSPRRLALLAQVGFAPDAQIPSDVEETPRRGELPRALALRLAEEKARKIGAQSGAQSGGPAVVLAADTVVALGRRVIPVPANEAEARAGLRLLSGRRHRVYGGVAVLGADGRMRARVVETHIAFKRLEAREIEDYLRIEEWRGVAGGYAIQGRAAAFARWIRGSYSNVVGLPLFETVALLRAAGIAPKESP